MVYEVKKMRGASTRHSRFRPCSGRRTLRRCENNVEGDNVILIDVDSDHFDNVIIIDVPDSLPKKRKSSSILRKQPLQTVICIDDDESPDNVHSFAGTSSSRSFVPPTEDFEDVDAEENTFIQEIVTPIRLSKCKRTYSGKAFTGKGYGLNLDTENNPSANDQPDCELMEDISGKVQEQWEKAFYRRKKGVKNGQPCMRSQNCASRIINDNNYHQTVGRQGANDEHMEASYDFHTDILSSEDEGSYPLINEEDAHYNSTYVSVGGSSFRGQHSPSIHAELENHQHFEPGSSSCHNRKRFKNSSSYSSHNEHATKEVKKSNSRVDENYDYGIASSVKDDVASRKYRNSFEVEADPDNVFASYEFRESPITDTRCVDGMEHLESCDPHESVEKTYNLTSVRSSFMSSTLPDKQGNCNLTPSSDAIESVSGGLYWFQNSLLGSRDGIKKGFHGESRHAIDGIRSPGNIHVHTNEVKVRLDDFVSNSGEVDKDDDFHSENGQNVDSVESCMIGEREKLKETDEYKRAMEEEWASRQQALKIQAEEAQLLRRLQKRRKAESMRVLDMERRQKERIEEMRSTQKKDEENMNLKEVIRAEVRKELNKLEMACQNMASLLHSFGIEIEGWPNPSPQEVQTAYKRALLTFHPDRASQSDIRQQVEAEEKFKIMNRFKEKLSLVR